MVEVPGGQLRLDRVTPEHMAPMHRMKSMPVGIMAPEGYRRFTVEVTLASQTDDGLSYSADQFRVTGKGMKPAGPIDSPLDDGVVPEDGLRFGSLQFEVPEKAMNLALSFRGGERAIAFDASPATNGHSKSHGNNEGSPAGDRGSQDHDHSQGGHSHHDGP